MDIERKEQFNEIKRLGGIEVEKTPDGGITRINEIHLWHGDKIIAREK